MIAALYVDTVDGPYPRVEGVDTWGVDRDAMRYPGPGPVIAHPPCGHWGKFWWRCKQPESFRAAGPRAVNQVRVFGGVLEHPEGSRLWSHCGLPRPGEGPDRWGGRTLRVDQCDFGHPAQKPTWLYMVRCTVPPLPSKGTPSHVMVRKRSNTSPLPECPRRLRHITPLPLALWLVDAVAGG